MTEEQLIEWMVEADKAHLIENTSDKYHKDKSSIQGVGLFASADIISGEYVGIVSFGNKRSALGRYVNHSGNPNIKFVPFNDPLFPSVNLICNAIRDINKNEELLVNYRHK
jgi:SET domain-containing protein